MKVYQYFFTHPENLKPRYFAQVFILINFGGITITTKSSVSIGCKKKKEVHFTFHPQLENTVTTIMRQEFRSQVGNKGDVFE